MLPTNDPDPAPVGPDMEACLSRTRSSVLNVLVGMGGMIAASGGLLRRRAGQGVVVPAPGSHDGLLFGLIVVAVASYFVRRAWLRRTGTMPADGRAARFFWTHVGSAAIAAVGIPLGLLFGWYVDPHLDAVIPFWVVPLALGFMALPRRGELEDLGPSSPSPEAPST